MDSGARLRYIPGQRGFATKRRLAALLAADVVGYSRLVGANEGGALAAFMRPRADIVDPRIAEHSGRIVKLMGDGLLVAFAGAADLDRTGANFKNFGLPD